MDSKSSPSSGSGTTAHASVASTVISGGGDVVASDTAVVARLSARIEQLERELHALRQENAALKDDANSTRAECVALRQQQKQIPVVIHDIKSPVATPPPHAPSNAVVPNTLFIPPPPHQTPPNAPGYQPFHIQNESSRTAMDSTSIPGLFQHQLEQHAQVQMQQLQQRQQQIAQRQQLPISRPGPALASTFDALSYTNREGLKLPTLELPQLLGPHANLSGETKEGTPIMQDQAKLARPQGTPCVHKQHDNDCSDLT
jgi:outer membrane murein-binding lipoprotein Lpp